MKCRIAENLVDTDEINIIAINGIIFKGILTTSHVTFRLKNGDEINYDSVPSYEDALTQIGECVKFLKSNGQKNFAVLDDRFIINMDNVRRLSWKSNDFGMNVVELICKNRHAYTLYEGQKESYAQWLVNQYTEQEEKYLQSQTSRE